MAPLIGQSDRLHFLDALRGLAAACVMVFHFYSGSVSPIHSELAASLPIWTDQLISHMYLGVELFFVLSGFVIAYSMDGNRHNLRYAGNFIVRRSLRLDPPFWTACVLMLAYLLVRWPEMWHGFYLMFGGYRGLLANMFYLQNLSFIYPAKSILDVSWTLCLEVQFYLSYLLVLVVTYYAASLAGRYRVRAGQAAVMVAVAAIGLWSLWNWTSHHGVGFTQRSWMFFMGVGVFASLRKGVPVATVLTPLVALCIWFAARGDADGLLAALTATAIYFVGIAGRLSTTLAYRPLLYLGRISYSLYLLHLVVGLHVLSLLWDYLGGGALSAWLCFFAGIASSILSAELLHRFVEAPSNNLSRRLKQKKLTPKLAAPVTVPTPSAP